MGDGLGSRGKPLACDGGRASEDDASAVVGELWVLALLLVRMRLRGLFLRGEGDSGLERKREAFIRSRAEEDIAATGRLYVSAVMVQTR